MEGVRDPTSKRSRLERERSEKLKGEALFSVTRLSFLGGVICTVRGSSQRFMRDSRVGDAMRCSGAAGVAGGVVVAGAVLTSGTSRFLVLRVEGVRETCSDSPRLEGKRIVTGAVVSPRVGAGWVRVVGTFATSRASRPHSWLRVEAAREVLSGALCTVLGGGVTGCAGCTTGWGCVTGGVNVRPDLGVSLNRCVVSRCGAGAGALSTWRVTGALLYVWLGV